MTTLHAPAHAITLTCPWGFGFRELGKGIENRGWAPPDYLLGKAIAIHAGKAPALTPPRYRAWDATWETLRDIEAEGIAFPTGYVLTPEYLAAQSSAIVVVGTLAGWFLGDGGGLTRWSTFDGLPPLPGELSSPWCANGQYHWIVRERVSLPTPVPAKGAQGIWSIPYGVKQAIQEQLVIASNAAEHEATSRLAP